MFASFFDENTFPAAAHGLAARLLALGSGLFLFALFLAFFVCPIDATQGHSYRILFIHVASAWMSLLLYLLMAFCALFVLLKKSALSATLMSAIAPTGALMTFLALTTGSLWGKPTWGTYWVWDARLTSELLLLFLYIGFLALENAIRDRRRTEKATALLSLVGVVNVPIVYFSVVWWNTLHQGASIGKNGASMATVMLVTLLTMVLAFMVYSAGVILKRASLKALERTAKGHGA